MNESDFPAAWPRSDGLHRVQMDDGRWAWLKRRRDMPASFFAAEARGLAALASAGGLRVPAVWCHAPQALLVEDLGAGTRGPGFALRAGAGLARQHRNHGARFGLEHEGWCGNTLQDNTPDSDGHRFFAERRLLPQARRAQRAARLDHADLARVERLCSRLPGLVPAQPPVLLHGDLWSGNLHCCEHGEPALIDAGALHHGWAEAELAMLTLFGDPGAALFRAYAEHAPLEPDWRERAPLYNLYHLLNHLNLFGSGYLGAVQSVLQRFAGPR